MIIYAHSIYMCVWCIVHYSLEKGTLIDNNGGSLVASPLLKIRQPMGIHGNTPPKLDEKWKICEPTGQLTRECHDHASWLSDFKTLKWWCCIQLHKLSPKKIPFNRFHRKLMSHRGSCLTRETWCSWKNAVFSGVLACGFGIPWFVIISKWHKKTIWRPYEHYVGAPRHPYIPTNPGALSSQWSYHLCPSTGMGEIWVPGWAALKTQNWMAIMAIMAT